MTQTATLYFVEGSAVPSVTLQELKEKLLYYRDQLAKTGRQLGWDYAAAAFPYTIEEDGQTGDNWFYLRGDGDRYRCIVLGVGREQAGDAERHYVKIVLPDGSTHGDKAKANELCKYLAREYQAELHLFNGRIMYYNPRK